MSGKVSEGVSNLEAAVNDKNQDQNKITSAYDEVRKLLKGQDDIVEFNKSISDGKNDIAAFKGLSLAKIDENGNMEFSSPDGKSVEFNSKSNFKPTSENQTETNQPKPVDFKIDENTGKATYTINKGDTIWGVAERVCAERNQGKSVSALDVYKEMNNIIKENPQLNNPNRIKEGRDSLVIPKDTVTSLLEARKTKDESKNVPTKEIKADPTADQSNNDKTKETKADPTVDQSNNTLKTDANCNTPQVGPEKRSEFLVQEQNWLLSKGQKKETIFADIDADGDTHLTTTEINRYRVENTIDKNQNHDAYLSELAQKREDIEEVNDDETWDENDGITKGDITGWTDSQTQADRKAKEVEQKKIEQENKKAEEQKANEDAKALLQDQKFFLKVSGYDGTITVSDADKYRQELEAAKPANEQESQQLEREKKALRQISQELENRSTKRVHPKTGDTTSNHDGVMTQADSQNWKN